MVCYTERLGENEMPINGLRKRDLAFPEIGRIRKGAPKEKNRPGGDLKHFRVEIDPLEEKAIEDFTKAYSDEPRELNIRFPFNEIDRLWDYWLEAYTAGSMYAQSDGEKYEYLRDGISGEILVKDGIELSTGKPRKYVAEEPATHYLNKKGKETPLFCKPTGRLRVMIAELRRAAYLTVITNSWNDIEALTDQLHGLYDLSGGNLQGLPIVLKRRPRMVSTPGEDGKRVRREKWLLELEVDPKWAEARFKELERISYPELPAGETAQVDLVEALPAPDTSEEIIDAEVKEVKEPVKPRPEGKVIRWSNKQLEALVKGGVGADMDHAEEIMELSDLPETAPDGTLIWWGRQFLSFIDADKTAPQAAAYANRAWKEHLEKQEKKGG